MKRASWIGVVFLLPVLASSARALGHPGSLERINQRLAGRIIDHTHNHGADRRIWSAVLGEWRDLYVYVPPGFDPAQSYPVMIWLHGVDEDERSFLNERGVDAFDSAIVAGKLPPLIIAIPDGTLRGRRPTLFGTNPLWLNSRAGSFRDYLVEDVWGFVLANYPVRPEREAHVLAGFSGGGGAAFRIGILYRSEFGVVFGIHPPLNVRWLDCRGRYFAPFDPCCWGWRTNVRRGREPVARFYGVIVIRLRQLVYPLFGRGPEAVRRLSMTNPIEMIDHYHLREGELAMYVAYGGRDQFNITAQVDSFLYRARQRGLTVAVGFDPAGRHNWPTARGLLPGVIDWLGPVLAPYSPPVHAAQ